MARDKNDNASAAANSVDDDDDDDDDYEDPDLGVGGNRLLEFMFGNVDGSGDLDIDYLDEDAKEHLAALAHTLGPSLTDIDLSKSSPAQTDASEQDYDEKAEDAVDYEDIDEQYDGPEIQDTTEEDHLLSKKQYFASSISLASLNHKSSVFDEENYDDEEETAQESEIAGNQYEAQSFSLPGKQLEINTMGDSFGDDIWASTCDVLPSADDILHHDGSLEGEHLSFDFEDFQEEPALVEEQVDSRSGTSLPVLCVEDGEVILRFSEIFGIHEPLKKGNRLGRCRNYISKEWAKPINIDDIIEDDEEAFLRAPLHDLNSIKYPISAIHNIEDDSEQGISGVDGQTRDSCLCAQPMKESTNSVTLSGQSCPLSPNFYPLDQEDWEDRILWGNSPMTSHGCSSSCISEHDSMSDDGMKLDKNNETEQSVTKNIESAGEGLKFLSVRERSFQAQSGPLESLSDKDLYSTGMKIGSGNDEVYDGDALRRFRKLSLQNKELLEGSWLDHIIWDYVEAVPKPKLILDLQDEQMLFEVLDQKDGEHLHSRAGAMVISYSSKMAMGDSVDLPYQGMASINRFNISNDKYYSNRKTSQQAKSHAKKRAFMGIKVMHSVPALKLQTMELKLRNKDIANFHRPKALWYPHDNEAAAKAQGTLITRGPMKIILLSLGGKGIKLQVDAEENLSSVKSKASKKLEFRSSEKVNVFYSGKELEDDKSLAMQNVRPNSVLHLVHAKIHLWPKAQKLPGENKPIRPPGAFKKKSDLSVKDGHVFLMEYCEERPLLLGNVGMGARLCTYYQKVALGDQTATSLRNCDSGLGNVLTLDPADKSPFLGDIGPGCSQSCLETNMYRAPIFPHKLPSTDYLLVRSAKGSLSLRRIDKLYVVGQQEPHMEVFSPGTKTVQTYLVNRMLIYVYREFRSKEYPGFLPSIRADELAAHFPTLTDAFIRKRLKHCADLKRGANGVLYWFKRRDFRIPTEEELRRMLSPENVCSYESMQAGLYRLKRLGISRLTHPVGLSSAMNQLPDEAIALAAASHIERELQITSWNLSSNFVACTNQNRENIERLEITGVGDPSGRGLGFSYVRITPKAPVSSALVKKKAAAARGSSSVTGTDADLRRLSMDAAREVLLKFNVPEEQIEKLTRWHRIALVRKLSSEQAASGVKVDATTLNKFARGQRMSFLQLQQQTREKCQEVWDRQAQSLSATDGDENVSDSEANSDLDSFAGDLENLLDAEECEEEDDGNADSKADKTDGVRGFKMRRCPSQAKTEEEIEDDEAEAALIRKLLEDDEAELKKRKKKLTGSETGYFQLASDNVDSTKKAGAIVRQIISTPNPDGSFSSKEIMIRDPNNMEKSITDRDPSGILKSQRSFGKNDDSPVGIIKKKSMSAKDGLKVMKEKKQTDKPVRESFVCGACGQLGHMRTNKNCPKYREDIQTSEIESVSGKSHLLDVATQLRTPKKLIPKGFAKVLDSEIPEGGDKGSKMQPKILPVKFKCGLPDKPTNKNPSGVQVSDKQNVLNSDMDTKSTGKINKIIISNKFKSHDTQLEFQRSPSVVMQLPAETGKERPRKKIIFKQSKGSSNVDQVMQAVECGIDHEFRKTKKIAELGSFEKQRKQEGQWFVDEEVNRNAGNERKQRDAVEKRRGRERFGEERWMREERRISPPGFTGYEAIRKEESQKAKKKTKKKKKRPDFGDEYLEHRSYRNDRRLPERDRAAKRRPVVDLALSEYGPLTKRRRGGEVVLSNILESIVEALKARTEISYLFLKPVTKKEAPDYLDIIERPMDLSTIRDKVRNLEYKSREDFRHDVWQITYNAHKYNDNRHPLIPPLADQLLEICDYQLDEKHELLTDAEQGMYRG